MTERTLRADRILAASVAIAVVGWLYLTAPSIGYARDEGFYFQAATEYGRWLELLVTRPADALTRAAVDAHFRINAEHPSLMKLLFGISHEVLHRRLDIIHTPGLAFRFPGMLLSGAAAGGIVLWGARAISRWAGLVAGLLFIGLPRVFHHAHLACFDMPVAAMILVTAYAYSRAATSGRVGWLVALGCCYGLALDTKHNAWSFPLVVLVHLLATRPARFRRWLPLVAMLTIGPLVLFVLWPWLWFDTIDRLRYWVEFHLRHDYYNMEFLGRTYHRPPMPRGYAWLMTLATVPFTTLAFFALGLFDSARAFVRESWRSVASAARMNGEPNAPSSERVSTDLLWLLCLLAAYAPWWFTSTPIFGGTKHWLAAYPFLCLFAGRGFELLAVRYRRLLSPLKTHRLLELGLCGATTAACVCAPLAITLNSVPYGLTAYTPLVGGAKGAASLGLNRTFWGYTSIALSDEMSSRLPNGGRVFVHDTALQSWEMHQRDGAIAEDLVPTLNIAQSKLGLYHHEPHMKRVEYQLWEAYGTTSPAAVATFEGVPVVWLYARPGLGK